MLFHLDATLSKKVEPSLLRIGREFQTRVIYLIFFKE